MSSLGISATTRTETGKGAVRRLRSSGQIPAVVYGEDVGPRSIKLRHDDLLHQLENEAFYSSILELNLDGRVENVVLREVHHHPAKNHILHADFQLVSSRSEITMSIPIHYLNTETSVGVKAGGVADILFNELSIRCLARDLPESIEVDVEHLDINDSLSFSDVKLPKGVKLSLFIGLTEEEISEQDQSIIAIHPARAEETFSDEVAADAETEEETATGDEES